MVYIEFDTNIVKLGNFIIFKGPLSIKTIWEKLHESTYLDYIYEGSILAFNGQELDKSKTLEDYNIPYESESKLTFTVQFLPHSKEGFMLFVQNIVLFASPFDTIEMIKYDIIIKKGLLFTRFFLRNNDRLLSTGTLNDNCINSHSNLSIYFPGVPKLHCPFVIST